MVQKQERMYLPAYDPENNNLCAGEDTEKRKSPLEQDIFKYRLGNLVAVSRLETATVETFEAAILSRSEKRIFREDLYPRCVPPKLSPIIPLENGRLVLKTPSLDNYLAAARAILEFEPQVNDWLYEELGKGYRKKSYDDYVSGHPGSLLETREIIPFIYFKFDYQTVFFPGDDGVVIGLAKIGKAGGYEFRTVVVRDRFLNPSFPDYLVPDTSRTWSLDSWGDTLYTEGKIPIYALILTAQSSKDLDALEDKLGLK